MRKPSFLFVSTALCTMLLAVPLAAQEVQEPEPEPTASGNEGQAPGEPVETSPPNAENQQPAFKGQTRAPQPPEMPQVETTVVADGLPQLWAMEFLPDGSMLVTAKEGALQIVSPEGEAGPAIEGVPEVDGDGQGGLLDVALSPDFEESGRIFFSFSEPREGGNGTSVASGTLVRNDAGGGVLEGVTVIFRQMPTYEGDLHFGSRLVVAPDGNLFVTVGERSDEPIRDQAQDIGSGLGKVFRIAPDGTAPSDNPFVDTEGALPEIWSFGHRNLQSAALDREGLLWTVEHGPLGGDELNRPEGGVNHGWPIITYGLDYSGEPIGEGITASEGMAQPVYYWDPVIAPSGMAWYEGGEFPEWENSFLIGGLVSMGLVVVHLEGGKVAFEERVPLEARTRDVKVGPDGAVYVITEADGTSQIVRLTRAI